MLSKWRKFLQDPILVISIVIVVLSILYLVFSFSSRSATSVGVNVLEEYVKAVTHLNKSSTAIVKRLTGFVVHPDVDIGEAVVNRDKIKLYLTNISSTYGSQDTFFARVASNYLLVADAAIDTLQTLQAVNRSFDTLREVLKLIALCRIDEALNKFKAIEGDVYEAISTLSNALKSLAKVDVNLLAEKHVPIVNESKKKIENALKSMLNAYKLVKIAEVYRDDVEALCSGKLLPSEILQNLKNEVDNVRPSGPLALDISNAKNALLTRINQVIQQLSQSSNGSQDLFDQGSGAGYAPPESDD